MKRNLAALAMGVVFALGLGISGMTQPAKVMGFLDFFGDWDPALTFVMGGAVLVYGLLFPWLMRRRKAPLLADTFSVPERKSITPRLVVGASLFGVGWGLSGFCPGPALVSAVTGQAQVLVFLMTMVAGMLLFKGYTAFLGWTQRKSDTRLSKLQEHG